MFKGKKNKEQRKAEEAQARVRAYLEELKELDKKHGLCLVPILKFQTEGIKPAIEVRSFEIIEPKKPDAEQSGQAN